MIIQNILAVTYLLTTVSLVYMIKRVLDSERILDNHPYFRNRTLRFFLILDVASPLALVVTPEYSDAAHLCLSFGLIGTFSLFGWIYNIHIIKVGIKLSGVPENVVSAVQYLSFNSDKYTQINNGVFARRLISSKDIRPGLGELGLLPYLSFFDFAKEIVLVIRFSEEADFPEHEHPGYEHYLMVEGAAEILPGFVLNEGERHRIEPGTPHYFAAKKNGLILVGLQNI